MASLSPIAPQAPRTSRPHILIGAVLGIALIASLMLGWRLLGGIPFLLYAGALMAGFGAALLLRRIDIAASGSPAQRISDWGLMRSVMIDSHDAIAITNRAGKLVCASPRYESLAGHMALPRELAFAA